MKKISYKPAKKKNEIRIIYFFNSIRLSHVFLIALNKKHEFLSNSKCHFCVYLLRIYHY
jgi:hypothetical protein